MPNQKTNLMFAPAVPDRDRALIVKLTRSELDDAGSEDYRSSRRLTRTAAMVMASVSLVTLIAIWIVSGPIYMLIMVVMLAALARAVRVAWYMNQGGYSPAIAGRDRAQDAAHAWRGHYLDRNDFHDDTAALLKRLQAAELRISSSTAAAAALQHTASRKVLAEQTWQVARDLAAVSRLRRELPSTDGPAAEEASAQHAMIADRLATLEQRVQATEKLAAAVVAADSRLRAETTLETTRGLVLDLAAGGAQDELAIADAEHQLMVLAEIAPEPPNHSAHTTTDQRTATQIYLDGGGDPDDTRTMAILAEADRSAGRRQPRPADELDVDEPAAPATPMDDRPLHAHEITTDDAALIRALNGAVVGPDATFVLPSGRAITGAEMRQWLRGDRTDEKPEG